MNPAYVAAQQASNNFSNSFRRVKDENAIESILSDAIGTNDPKVLQNSISKILSQVSPDRQGVALQYLQNAYTGALKKQEQTRLEEQERKAAEAAGYTPNAPPGVQTQQVKDNNKQKRLNAVGLGNPGNEPIAMGNSPTNGFPPQIAGKSGTSGTQVQPPFLPGQAPAQQNPVNVPFFKNKTKDQLIALSGHPDKEISEPAKAQLKILEEEEKQVKEDKIQTRKEQIKFHEETQKYDEDLIKQSRIAKNQVETVANIEKAVASGNVKPSSWTNILKGFGKVGEKISEAIINKDEATLQASIPTLLEGWKDVFGVRLTDADLRLLQDKLPSIGKTPEANRAITGILKKYADMTLLRSKIASDIKEENKGLRPLGYADKIEKRFDEMVKPVKIINPNNNKVIEIPAYKLSDALASGARLANE